MSDYINNSKETFKEEIEKKIEHDLAEAMLDLMADGDETTDPIKIATFIKDTVVKINSNLKIDIFSKGNGISEQEIRVINEATQTVLRKYLEMLIK